LSPLTTTIAHNHHRPPPSPITTTNQYPSTTTAHTTTHHHYRFGRSGGGSGWWYWVLIGLGWSSSLHPELLLSNDDRPPVVGPITSQLIHFEKLYDHMTSLARKHPTFRFITPTHSEVYTVDPVTVEYILKTNFANYSKLAFNLYNQNQLSPLTTTIAHNHHRPPPSPITTTNQYLSTTTAHTTTHHHYRFGRSGGGSGPPVVGPITSQLIHFEKLYDHMTSLARKHPTFRFITPTHSEVYTVDPVTVEYILNTNFANYSK
nr:cytochrome P450 [Tanacetum cinerariifolium]